MKFRKKQKTQSDLPQTPVMYPAGVCVVTEKGRYLIQKDGKKYRIPTEAIFKSWSFPLIIESTEVALSNHPLAVLKIGFRDGSLLNNIADGKLYLVSAGRLRHIVDPAVFDRLGINHSTATLVSDAEINIMRQGEPIY